MLRPALAIKAFGVYALAVGALLTLVLNLLLETFGVPPTPEVWSGRPFFEGLLGWAGVRRPVAVSGDPVEVRLLESGGEHLAFVFNHAATPATTSVALRVSLDGRGVEGIARREAVSVKASAEGLEWTGTIPPRDVRVLRVRPR